MLVEAAEQRRSLGFETKPPVIDHAASAATGSVRATDGLDWQSFSAYFPGRRRHDLDALTAYGAYGRSHEVDARSSDEPGRIEAERGQAGTTTLQDWEEEGGASF